MPTGDPPGLTLGRWAGSPSGHQPSHHARGRLFAGSLPLFCDRKDAKCLPSDRGVGRSVAGSVRKLCPLFSSQKLGEIVSEERASVGGASAEEENGFSSVYLDGDADFLARWMAPVAFAVMQHNAPVSQPPLLLAGGAWHGHWAPAAPPGLQAQGCP